MAGTGTLLVTPDSTGTTINTLPPSGQSTGANSLPVVLASDQSALPIALSSGTITQTVVTGTSGVLIAANALRKSLRWMNVGASVVTVAPGATAPTVGQGMLYEPNGSGAGHQGGSETINDPAVAVNAFAYSASAASIITVWECQ